jgi:hypothetical protein
MPPAGTRFDGDFAGQDTLIRGGGWVCGTAGYPLALSVREGRFDYPFAVNLTRTTPVAVQVASDGSFVRQLQYGTQNYTFSSLPMNDWLTVRGRIAGGTLDATITSDRCTWRLTAQRS